MSVHECQPKKKDQEQQLVPQSQVVQSSPSNSNIANEVNQLKAEIRVYFEHINLRLDKIQELSNQRK
jgi:hypothetical protein